MKNIIFGVWQYNRELENFGVFNHISLQVVGPNNPISYGLFDVRKRMGPPHKINPQFKTFKNKAKKLKLIPKLENTTKLSKMSKIELF